MKTDLEIAQNAEEKSIYEVAGKLNIPEYAIIPYGNNKAKIDTAKLMPNKDGKLILVTAINPTPAGEGKTTVSIGLADALQSMGIKTVLALREPSLGPVFGIKGGAAGGGYSQVIPMEDINLHFTGDLHAITSANNLLCAMVDNHIKQGNSLNLDLKRITVRRCLDMNDRQLRHIISGLGSSADGVVREDGFDITAASEVMAVLCLSDGISDLKRRLNNICIGYDTDGNPVAASEIGAGGAMAALLKDAIKPNLVQTLEHTPVLMHGGPFANIAHGCNSISATKTALSLGDYVVTEAGFGADLGAEKFLDIKCRAANLWPDAVVLVATIRALKFHGGVKKENLNDPDTAALEIGFANLDKHIENLKNVFGVNVVVAINKFPSDSQEEIDVLQKHLAKIGIKHALSTAWGEGGKGALKLAREVKSIIDSGNKNAPQHPYELGDDLKVKIHNLAVKVYGAENVEYTSEADKKIASLKNPEYLNYPICIAKTQYSFSDDAAKLGAPSDYNLNVRDIVVNSGAEFIVVICGDIMRMPGLPKIPAAVNIDIDINGKIEGLF